MSDTTFIGIDLGTTYSCAGVWKNNKVEIITNERGNRITPSYVSFIDNQRYIGESAKEQIVSNSKNTLFDIKRLIGRKFNDEVVQNDLHHYPFEIVESTDKNCLVNVEIDDEIKSFRPEEISAMILSKLKSDGEKFIGKKIDRAVITVPAYFNDLQRQATKDAGRIAGLEVLRIINEPTSSAIAYNLSSKKGVEERKVLVYDLGGGTLDVTVLITDGGLLSVKSTSGDTHLGGEDFDNRMVDYCLKEFCKKTFKTKTLLNGEETIELCDKYKISTLQSLYRIDIDKTLVGGNKKYEKYIDEIIKIKTILSIVFNDVKLVCKLKKECENAKKVLSMNETTNMSIDNFFYYENNVYDFKLNLTKNTFEKICESEFEKCLEPVNIALQCSKFSHEDIDDVVLVGGSTRIPKIREMLGNKFGKDKLKFDINPDEAIAYGAVVQCAILCGEEHKSINDIVLADVTPLSLGLETSGGVMTKIINRNTSVPCKMEKIFTTNSDNQPAVTIKVFQGERVITKDNELLGSFDLHDIPPMPKGVPKIRVLFEVDCNGILLITATEESLKNTNQITITNNSNRMSEQEILDKIKDAEKYEEDDKKFKDKINAKIKLETYLSSMERFINVENFKNLMGDKIYYNLNNKFVDISNNIEEQQYTKEQYIEMLEDLKVFLQVFLEEYENKKNQSQT